MSFANFVGDTPLGDTTRIDTLLTEKIKRVSVFQNIDVEGDLDFGLTGRIVGTLGVETPQLTTQANTVATLTGADISFANAVGIETKLDFANGVAINLGEFAGDSSGAVVCIGDLSGNAENNVLLNATGTPLELPEVGATYIAPIRGVSHGVGVGVVVYDPVSAEVTYSLD